MISGPLWVPWLRARSALPAGEDSGRSRQAHAYVACPHCTNRDTLSLHCHDDRCGWATCTCGAMVYSSRRHRHPSHGGEADTCHDPRAAA